MKTIHKYQWPKPGECKVLSLPRGAVFVATGEQAGFQWRPQVWALVDIEESHVDLTYEDRRLFTAGTGWPLLDSTTHIGTVIDGDFVWHLVELPEPQQIGAPHAQ